MIEVIEADASHAEDVVRTIHASFAGRPPLDPPATATDETVESVAVALARHGGLLVCDDERPVGALLFDDRGPLLGLRRVGVLAHVRRNGVAADLAERAAAVAQTRGKRGLVLEAREELPATVRFWERLGYVVVDRDGPRLRMLRLLPLEFRLPGPENTMAIGTLLGRLVRAGDLVVLSGDLGAGKTTLTQGIGEGLGVRGPITSPTFVISRVHPSLGDGPALVHVDAYRLHDAAELDDLDLDTGLERAVTVVEWGSGLAEALAADRLEVRLDRAPDDVRTMVLTPVGARWEDVDLREALSGEHLAV